MAHTPHMGEWHLSEDVVINKEILNKHMKS